MADNEKILKADPNNQDAKAQERIEQKIAEKTPLTPPPRRPRLRLPIHQQAKRSPELALSTPVGLRRFGRG